MPSPILEIHDLAGGANEPRTSSRGSRFSVAQGEVHALMGPNGSGKSRCRTASWAGPLHVTAGAARSGFEARGLPVHERARAASSSRAPDKPVEVPGFPTASSSTRSSRDGTRRPTSTRSPLSSTSPRLPRRFVNQDLSGGEKKPTSCSPARGDPTRVAYLDRSTRPSTSTRSAASPKESSGSPTRPRVLLLTPLHAHPRVPARRPGAVLIDGAGVAVGWSGASPTRWRTRGTSASAERASGFVLGCGAAPKVSRPSEPPTRLSRPGTPSGGRCRRWPTLKDMTTRGGVDRPRSAYWFTRLA